MSKKDGLGGIIGIRGREGVRGWSRRPTLFVKTFKMFCFVPTERNREFSWSVFYTPAAKYDFSRRLAHPRHTSPTEV